MKVNNIIQVLNNFKRKNPTIQSLFNKNIRMPGISLCQLSISINLIVTLKIGKYLYLAAGGQHSLLPLGVCDRRSTLHVMVIGSFLNTVLSRWSNRHIS